MSFSFPGTSVRPTRAPSANAQLPSLTSLRGVAALWVVLYHFSVQCLPNLDTTPYTSLIHKGYLAVDMFFLLSGLVMTHVYHRAFLNSVSQNYRSFIVARIARIYPLHLLVLLLFVATAVALHVSTSRSLGTLQDIPLQGPRSLGAFFANVFMLQGLEASQLSWNYPAWSISVEFVAYLVFPFALPAMWQTSDRAKIVIGSFLFGLILLLAFLSNGNFDQWDGPLTLLRCLPEFMLGTLLYSAYRADENAWLGRDSFAFLILAAVIGCLHFNAPDLVIICLFPCLILAAVGNRGFFAEWANSAPLIWLGDISYSLYLIHGFVQFLADRWLSRFAGHDGADLSASSSFMVMLVMVGVCLALAHLSYACVEVGCRQYLRGLLDARKRRQSARIAPSARIQRPSAIADPAHL